tara:strand:- start:3166 stop:5220 length:2055 start_codon:yes stop_codon:yes gene_type:complete
MARNRVIYQSEALFVSPNSTSFHFKSPGNTGLSSKATPASTDGIETLTIPATKGTVRAQTSESFYPVWKVGDQSVTTVSAAGQGGVVEVSKVDQDCYGGADLYDATKAYGIGEIVTFETGGALALYIVTNAAGAAVGSDPTTAADWSPAVNGGGGADDLNTAALWEYPANVDGQFDYGKDVGDIPIVKYDGKIWKRINLGAGGAGTLSPVFIGAGVASANLPGTSANWEEVTEEVGYITEVTVSNPGNGYATTAGEIVRFLKQFEIDDSTAGLEDVEEELQIFSIATVAAGTDAETVVAQLSRVQTANYNFTINRTDVNQFGQLGRIDSLVLEAPTVGLDFSYLLTNGENERLLGFNTNDASTLPSTTLGSADITTALSTATSAFQWHSSEDSKDGNNYFVLTVPEGDDAVGTVAADEDKSVISVGNGYITDYSIEAAVGSLPTASLTVEGFNIKSDSIGSASSEGIRIPAVDTEGKTAGNDGLMICDEYFELPAAVEDNETGEISALRPGDIELYLGEATESSLLADIHGEGASHIQSFSLSCPIGRSVIQRLGNQFGFGRSIDFPVTMSVSVNAILSELEEANLIERLYTNPTCNLAIALNEPKDPRCTKPTAAKKLVYIIAGARLESENYSSSIGDNKTVDLTFNAQLGGPNDKSNGLFIFGTGTKRNPRYFNSGGVFQDL